MRLLTPRRAESLVESIVAITVIVLATTAALSLIRTSISGNRVIAEKVVAVNLALEGIEAVKNIRDTNYLNYASKPDDCWDAIDATDISTCDTDYGTPTATLMRDLATANATYYLKRNIRDEERRLAWELKTASGFEDITLYEIYDSTGSTLLTKLYAQSGLDTYSSLYVPINEDAFRRSVTFSENAYDTDNAVDITVTVEWDANGETYSVDLTSSIVNVY